MSDKLDQLFEATRVGIPDDGFSERVMQRIIVPPSRNIYRVPALAMAVVSVVILVLTGGRDLGMSDFFSRVGSRMERLSTVSNVPTVEWSWPISDDGWRSLRDDTKEKR